MPKIFSQKTKLNITAWACILGALTYMLFILIFPISALAAGSTVTFTLKTQGGQLANVSGKVIFADSNKVIAATANFTTNVLGEATVQLSQNLPTSGIINVTVPNFLSGSLQAVNFSGSTNIAIPDLIAGDLNADGSIDNIDYSLLRSKWFATVENYDLNNDQVTNALDFSLLAQHWQARDAIALTEFINPSPVAPFNLHSVMGSYFMTRNFPATFLNNDQVAISEYYQNAKIIGNHVSVLQRWDEPNLEPYTRQIAVASKQNGLKFFLHIDPLTGSTHSGPAVPSTINGTSFANAEVRQAFKTKMLEYAALKPDLLGIGTEVNLMLYAHNQSEFDSYVSLAQETYTAIKQQYPNQQVTISFSLDIMEILQQYNILQQFKNSVDVFSFTAYPNVFSYPVADTLPSDYFSKLRTYLPQEKIAISEVSWYSGGNSSPDNQDRFYARLPELMEGLKPTAVTIFFLYDLPSSFSTNQQFSTGGLLDANGAAKKSWSTVAAYPP